MQRSIELFVLYGWFLAPAVSLAAVVIGAVIPPSGEDRVVARQSVILGGGLSLIWALLVTTGVSTGTDVAAFGGPSASALTGAVLYLVSGALLIRFPQPAGDLFLNRMSMRARESANIVAVRRNWSRALIALGIVQIFYAIGISLQFVVGAS